MSVRAGNPAAMQMPPKAKALRLNVIVNFIGSGWSALMGLAFVPLYIHYLGTEAYGLVGLFATLQVCLSVLDLGLGATLNREMARFRGGAHSPASIRNLLLSVEIVYAGIAGCLALAIYLGAGWLALHWVNSQTLSATTLVSAFSVLGLAIAFRFVGGLYRNALAGMEEQIWLNAIMIGSSTLRGAGVLPVLMFISPTIEAFFIYQGGLAALEAWTLRFAVGRLLPPSPAAAVFDVKALHKISSFAGGMTLISLLAIILTQADKLLLSTLLPLNQFAYYSLAATVAGALYLIAAPINTAFGPRLAMLAVEGSERSFASAYHQYAQLMSICVVPAALIGAAFAEPLIKLWTGNAELTSAAAPIASILLVGTMLNTIMSAPYMAQLAFGWTRFAAIANIISLALFIPSILYAVPAFGGICAAWLWLLLNLGYIVIGLPIMHRRILKGEFAHWLLLDFLPPVLAAAAPILLARWMVPANPSLSNAAACLFIAIVAGCALAAAAVSTPLGRRFIFALTSRASQGFSFAAR